MTFQPTFTFWLATNYRPMIQGIDQGIWGRMRLVPWLQSFSNDPAAQQAGAKPARRRNELEADLWNERSGILNWMLTGCLAWQREGLGTAPDIEKATQHYRAEQDTVTGFIQAYFERDKNSTVPQARLRQAYEHWCEERDRTPLAPADFGQRLTQMGFRQVKRQGTGCVKAYAQRRRSGRRGRRGRPASMTSTRGES